MQQNSGLAEDHVHFAAVLVELHLSNGSEVKGATPGSKQNRATTRIVPLPTPTGLCASQKQGELRLRKFRYSFPCPGNSENPPGL